MNKFSEWLEKKDPELCEGLGIMRIVKAILPKGMMTMIQSGGCGSIHKGGSTEVQGKGPNEKTALKDALKKHGLPRDAKAKLLDREHDTFTFKVDM